MRSRIIVNSLICFIAVLTLRISPAEAQEVFYVDQSHPSASDSNTGSEASPWASISKAARTLVAGQKVYVKDGIYSEPNSSPDPKYMGIAPLNSGTEGSGRIIFEAYPGHTPVIDQLNFSGAEVATAGFVLIGNSYVTIKGFEIRNAETGILTPPDPATDHINISGNVIHDIVGRRSNIAGIRLDRCAYCVIEGNEIYNISSTESGPAAPAHGIQSYRMSYALIENNKIYNVNSGLYHKRAMHLEKGGIFRNNIVKNAIYGVQIGVSSSNDSAHKDWEIYDNVIVEFSSRGVFSKVYETISQSSGIIIRNNLFLSSQVDAEAIGIIGWADAEIYDNIFSVTAAGIWSGISTTNNVNRFSYVGHNLYAVFNVNILERYASNAAYFRDLAAWKAAYTSGYGIEFGLEGPVGLGSVEANPLFVAAATGNYALQDNSPAIGAGRFGGNIGPHLDSTIKPQPPALH